MASSFDQAAKDALAKKEFKEVKVVEKAAKGLTLRIPTIKKVETTAEKQEVIDKAVQDVRNYLTVIPSHMGDLVSRARGIRGASKEERAVRADELKELEAEVLAHLNSEEELLRDAARQAYAMAMASTAPPNKRLVVEVIEGGEFSRLPGLLEFRMLEPVTDESTKGAMTIKVYGKTYRVNGRREWANKLAEVITAAATRAAERAREWYKEEISGLEEAATITLADLLAEKPGRVFVTVSDVKNGVQFMPGGALLIESDGTKVKTLEARGHFQRVLSEIAEAGSTIPVSSLSKEKLYLGKSLPEDVFRHCQILHAILRRGVAEAQKETSRQERISKFQAEAEVEREALMTKATVGAAEWLSTDVHGSTVIYLGRKPWMVAARTKINGGQFFEKETPYFEVFFIVERTPDGVRIVEYPERLKPLFGERFAEAAIPGERFEGLKYPLGPMLRTVYAYEKAKAVKVAEDVRMQELKDFCESQKPEAPAEEPSAEPPV